jgi:catechol 2,3-dioxygenase-like lactoylglutathione lyase family enzyme
MHRVTNVNPILRFAALVVDCADHVRLAEFYRDAIGAEIVQTSDTTAWLKSPSQLTIFRTVEDYAAPTWPAMERPMQAHVDYWVDDLDEAHARLQGLGATTPDYQPERANGLIVMLDPAGHPFCIAAAQPPE